MRTVGKGGDEDAIRRAREDSRWGRVNDPFGLLERPELRVDKTRTRREQTATTTALDKPARIL